MGKLCIVYSSFEKPSSLKINKWLHHDYCCKIKIIQHFFKGVIRARMLKIGHFCLLEVDAK